MAIRIDERVYRLTAHAALRLRERFHVEAGREFAAVKTALQQARPLTKDERQIVSRRGDRGPGNYLLAEHHQMVLVVAADRKRRAGAYVVVTVLHLASFSWDK